jgi:serine/threonine protein kinase
VEVALKELKSDKGEKISAAAKADFEQESRILQKLHHPHLVQVFGVCTDAAPMLMVLEMLPGGDLKAFVSKNRDTLTCDKIISICGDVSI